MDVSERHPWRSIKGRGRGNRESSWQPSTAVGEMEWSHHISHDSLTTLSTRKFDKMNVLPLAEHLAKLRDYIDQQIHKSLSSFKEHPNLEDWSLLA